MSSRISRRTLLRGAGVAIGLPLLEMMEPARAFAGQEASKPPVRLMFVYTPGGVIMDSWTPKGDGADYSLSPTLGALERFKSDLLVLTGLDNRLPETGGNGHPIASSTWLSSAPLHQRDSHGYSTAMTVDQIAARQIGDQTRLSSLELGVSHNPTAIHSCNISWRAPGSPMGKDVHPRAVFARLFGDPQGDRSRKSVLDYVLESADALRREGGAADRNKIDEYLDSVRSIEKRIQFLEKNQPPPPPKVDWLEKLPENAEGIADPKTKAPRQAGIPLGDHLRMLQELAALGFQADCTRVVTLMYEGEDNLPPITEVGDTLGHHGLAHWGFGRGPNEVAKAIDVHQKVDRWVVEQFAHLLGKLKSIGEGEGTLLDHCLVLFGSGLSSGGQHSRANLPLVLAGKGRGQARPGRHLRFPKGTPMANLFLPLLDAAGIRRDRIADSTGPLPGLKG
jgi:hypothetical protein